MNADAKGINLFCYLNKLIAFAPEFIQVTANLFSKCRIFYMLLCIFVFYLSLY